MVPRIHWSSWVLLYPLIYEHPPTPVGPLNNQQNTINLINFLFLVYGKYLPISVEKYWVWKFLELLQIHTNINDWKIYLHLAVGVDIKGVLWTCIKITWSSYFHSLLKYPWADKSLKLDHHSLFYFEHLMYFDLTHWSWKYFLILWVKSL